MKGGIFYAVSVGPGEPDLLTLRSVRVLEKCPVICFPQTDSASGKKHHIAFDAVRGAVSLAEKKILFFPFSMVPDCAAMRAEYEAAVSSCESFLRQGMDVAFVSIGDVSLYSTGSRIADLVRERGFEVRFVPGVNSFSVAACEACLSLAGRNESVLIIPGDAFYMEETLRAALLSPGTKILMKMGRHLREILALVDALGLSERATLVQKASLPGQKIFRDEELRHLDDSVIADSYLSILIVKNNA